MHPLALVWSSPCEVGSDGESIDTGRGVVEQDRRLGGGDAGTWGAEQATSGARASDLSGLPHVLLGARDDLLEPLWGDGLDEVQVEKPACRARSRSWGCPYPVNATRRRRRHGAEFRNAITLRFLRNDVGRRTGARPSERASRFTARRGSLADTRWRLRPA